jgi:DNA-binding MarR family transcriptional regulator
VTQSGFSKELADFIAERIESADELAILMCLRSKAEKAWTPIEVAEALQLHPATAWGWLAGLHSRGLLVRETNSGGDTFRFAPSPEDAELVAQLATAWSQRPAQLTALITETAVDELRAFSQAFLFRRKDT